MLSAADLLYDPETHTSRAPDGRPVPHVTAILDALGLTADYEALQRMGSRQAQHVRLGRARGSAVHADCHAYDENDLDPDESHPLVRPYLEAWAEFRAAKGARPLAREKYVFHSGLWYCGTLDGLFDISGRVVLVDIKTGEPEEAAAHLQTVAYQLAWETDPAATPIDERWSVQLIPGRRVPFRIIDYSSRPEAGLDAWKWQACLCVYGEQRRRQMR
jgi:hypothetical protein